MKLKHLIEDLRDQLQETAADLRSPGQLATAAKKWQQWKTDHDRGGREDRQKTRAAGNKESQERLSRDARNQRLSIQRKQKAQELRRQNQTDLRSRVAERETDERQTGQKLTHALLGRK